MPLNGPKADVQITPIGVCSLTIQRTTRSIARSLFNVSLAGSAGEIKSCGKVNSRLSKPSAHIAPIPATMITPNSSDTDLRATLPPVGDDDMTGGATRAARKFPEGFPTLSKFNGLPPLEAAFHGFSNAIPTVASGSRVRF